MERGEIRPLALAEIYTVLRLEIRIIHDNFALGKVRFEERFFQFV